MKYFKMKKNSKIKVSKIMLVKALFAYVSALKKITLKKRKKKN